MPLLTPEDHKQHSAAVRAREDAEVARVARARALMAQRRLALQAVVSSCAELLRSNYRDANDPSASIFVGYKGRKKTDLRSIAANYALGRTDPAIADICEDLFGIDLWMAVKAVDPNLNPKISIDPQRGGFILYLDL